jgi:hypothetical protein
MEFLSQVVSKTYSILFSAKFGPFSNPFRGRARPFTMNVRNEPVQEIFCVVNVRPPPYGGGNFVSLNIEKAYQFRE